MHEVANTTEVTVLNMVNINEWSEEQMKCPSAVIRKIKAVLEYCFTK